MKTLGIIVFGKKSKNEGMTGKVLIHPCEGEAALLYDGIEIMDNLNHWSN